MKTVYDKKHLLIFLSLFLLSLSCKKDSTIVDPPVTTPGKQTDIEWPSLAKSPWPMFGGNPQFAGRSQYKGPITGNKSWQLFVPGINTTLGVTSPVMGSDSTIYFASSYEPYFDGSINLQAAYLYACTQDGKIKWKVRLGKDSTDFGSPFVDTAPVVLNDSSIVIATPRGYVMSFLPTGKLQWVYQTGDIPIYCSTISVGKNGDLYFIDYESYLCSLSNKGQLQWRVKYRDGFNYSNNRGIAISPDGNTLYLFGKSKSNSLFAISSNGGLQWVFDAKLYLGAIPLIDNAGNIYVGTTGSKIDSINMIYSIKNDGAVRWKYKKKGTSFQNLTMDVNGYLYFNDQQDTTTSLVSLDYDGNYRWSYNLLNKGVVNRMICDGNNSVYVFTNELLVISENGVLLQNIPVTKFVWTSPLIGFDNSLFVTNVTISGNYLVKIK